MMMIMRGWFAWHFPIMLLQSQKEVRDCAFFTKRELKILSGSGDFSAIYDDALLWGFWQCWAMMICGDRKPLDKWWPPSIQSHSCEILVSPQTIINTINISTKKSSPAKLLSFHCLDVRLKTQEYSCNTHYLRGAKQNLAYSVHQSLPAINILSSLYHNHVRVQTCERRSWRPPSLVRWVPPSWVPPPSSF